MKHWRSYLVLSASIVLILVSFLLYGLRVSRTAIPAGSTPQQTQELIRKYGLDRPIVEQYAGFLFTFLPGLTLLGIYATVGLRRQDFQHWILTKIFIVLMLVTNTITILNFLVTAQASLQESLSAFVLSLVVAGLALVNFVFLLVIWNGYRWAVWSFGITTFVIDTLKFVGSSPIFPLLFELSAVVMLIFLVRTAWREMD